jgi:hypothetical protein
MTSSSNKKFNWSPKIIITSFLDVGVLLQFWAQCQLVKLKHWNKIWYMVKDVSTDTKSNGHVWDCCSDVLPVRQEELKKQLN